MAARKARTNRKNSINRRKFRKTRKREKRNNIIIKNAQIKGENSSKAVEDYIREKLSVEVKINEAFELTKGILLAKVQSWKEKKMIMENTQKLRNTNVYIEHDMTVEERKIQKELRQLAKEQREKGSEAKVGYQKIIIDKKVHTWNDIKKSRPPKN